MRMVNWLGALKDLLCTPRRTRRPVWRQGRRLRPSSRSVAACTQPLEARLVLSASPVAVISPPQTVNEGSYATVSAAGSYDPDWSGMLEYTWDFNNDGYFGDGWGEQATFDPSMWASSVPDGTPITIRVQVNDWTDPPTIASTTITVTNVAPTLSQISFPATADPQSTVMLNATVFDPGMSENLTYSLNRGDGSAVETGSLSNGPFSWNWSYTNPGDYTASLTVTDKDGGVAQWSQSIHINEPTFTPPQIPTDVNEGQSFTFALQSSQPVELWTIYWDYQNAQNPGSYTTVSFYGTSATVMHTYEDDYEHAGDPSDTPEDEYNIRIVARVFGHDYVVTGEESPTITVRNVAPTLTNVTGSSDLVSTRGTLFADFSDPATSGESWTYSVDWGDGQQVAGDLPAGPFSREHTYLAAGVYTVTLTVTDDDGGSDTGEVEITVAGIEVTGHATQWLDEEGEWQTVGEDEPVWAEDSLRWIADWHPTYGSPTIDHIEWQYRPWDQPQASWMVFANSVGDSPAIGNPGVGIWAVRAVARLTNGLLFEGAAVKRVAAKIQTIEWSKPTEQVLAWPGDLRVGSEFRFFPDAANSSQSLTNWIGVKITIIPAGAPVTVHLKIYDVDDPTDADGPIDNDALPDDVNAADNFGDMPVISATEVVDGEKIVDVTWEGASPRMQPGDNFRVLASFGNRNLANKVFARKDSATGELFLDANGDRTVQAGEEFRSHKQGSPIWATSRLTIWRKLHVYYGSMGTVEGNGLRATADAVIPDPASPGHSQITLSYPVFGDSLTRFENGRFVQGSNSFTIVAIDAVNKTITVSDLPGGVVPIVGDGGLEDDDVLKNGDDVPMPDVSGLAPAFAEAFVEVIAIPFSDNIPFRANLRDEFDARNALTFWPSATPRPTNSSSHWVTFLVSAFQDVLGMDNDTDAEDARRGANFGGWGSLIYEEVISDATREDGESTEAKRRDTVVHEVAHAVSGLGHLIAGDPVTDWGGMVVPPGGGAAVFTQGAGWIGTGTAIPSGWYPHLIERYLRGIRVADKPSG